MSASDAFGVVVRTIGLLVILYGAWLLWFGIAYAFGATKPDDEKYIVKDYLTGGIGFAVVGLVLLFWAPAIVGIAYGIPARPN